MGGMQRRKGATFEREVAALINERLGTSIGRKLGQARDGGNDLDLGPFVIEAKRRKTLGTVYGWLRQATAAALHKDGKTQITEDGQDLIPIVIAREDSGWPIVILSLHDFLTVVTDDGTLVDRIRRGS